jgi:hypothetical protein
MKFSRTFFIRSFIALGLWSLCAIEATGQGVGFRRTEYSVGTNPAAVAVGDFNGDGKLDLAVAKVLGDTVSILLGNGNGTFGASTDFATGGAPVGIVAEDFNGDNKLDIATVNNTDLKVSILLGNGDGTFGTKTDFATGTDPVGIAVGDFNGDGKPDLVTANRGGDNISILLGQGGGAFGANVNFATSTQPFQVVVGDFNGDAKQDVAALASLAYGSSAFSLLLGNGDGTFGPKTDFATGSGPCSLAKGDFNGDGKLDLVTANCYDFTASILLGKGDGTFDPKTDLYTDEWPLAVTAADFNADGKADFLTANEGACYYDWDYDLTYCNPTVTLWLGNGDGSFGGLYNFGLLYNSSPGAMATGDFNADGRIDVVVANGNYGSVSVLLQSAAVVPSSGHLDFGTQGVGSDSGVQGVTLDITGSFPLTVSSVTLTGTDAGEFSISADSCSGAPINPLSQCTVSVVFSPTTAGSKLASLVITHDAPYSPSRIYLSGTGLSSEAFPVFSPPSFDFGSQAVGVPSTMRAVVVTNMGAVTLDITSVTLTGPDLSQFSMVNGCGATLRSVASCRIDVAFTPTSAGAKSASVSVATNAAGSPDTVSLTGTGVGVPVVSLSRTGVTFPPQLINTPNPAEIITLTNTGTATLTISSITLAGTSAAEFSLTNNCGTSLAAGASCTISVVFTPTSAGAKSASVSIATDAASSPDSVALSGMGITPAALPIFSPTSLDFGSQPIGAPSVPTSVMLTNSGASTLNITSVTLTGSNATEFNLINGCGASLAAGVNCTFSVVFTPTSAGAKSASVSIATDAASSPDSVPITGTGVGVPLVSLSRTAVTFSPQVINTPSAAESVTLTNTGTATLAISGITLAGANAAEFNLTNNCGASLTAGGNCTFSVAFAPTSAGAKAALVSIATDAASSPDTVALTGTGVGMPLVSLSRTAVTFNPQVINTPSASESFTLTNTGTAALTISSITLAGANSAEFSLTNNCGASLAVGANCSISIVFTPASAGAKSASVSIATDAASSPDTVALSGTGIAPATVSLSPASLTFYPQLVNTTSPAQTVTLTNTGDATLTITSLTLGGASAGDYSRTDNCGASVNGGASCVITLTFRPSATGSRAASVTISTDANGSPHSVALNGTGADFSVNPPTGNPPVTVNPGGSASFTLSLAPTNGYVGNVALSCSTSSAEVGCAVPASVAVNGPTNVTVNVTTTSQAWMPFRGRPPEMSPTNGLTTAAAWIAFLLLLGAMLRWGMAQRGRMGSRLRPAVALVAIVLCAQLWMGCGGESIPRPSRTYAITVNASSAGVVRTIGLTVIVP